MQERDARLLLQTGTTHDLALLITHNEALRADKTRLKAQLRTERVRHADDLRTFQLDLQCLARTVEGLEREREANRVSPPFNLRREKWLTETLSDIRSL